MGHNISDIRSGKSKNLQEANLKEANLQGANLREADLQEANLQGADLRWANLKEANLQVANLFGANLFGANLFGANLRGANLCEANLREANLRGADLYSVNFSGAMRGDMTVECFGSWTGLYAYITEAFKTTSGKLYVRLGCYTRTVEAWTTDFWNNPSEFPNDRSEKSAQRKFAFETALAWLKIQDDILSKKS